MWYRHIIYKIPDERGCSLLTQPTFPVFFFFFGFQSHACVIDMTKWRQGLAMITILSAGMKCCSCCILDVQCPTFRFALAFLVFQS